jgi:hypothetical protein
VWASTDNSIKKATGMSSTHRNKEEKTLGETYETPHWVVRRLVEEIFLPVGLWVEPCAGNGRIIQAVEQDRPRQIAWHAVENRKECAANLRSLGVKMMMYCPVDFLTEWNARAVAKKLGRDVTSGQRYFDVCITNPPFSKALEVANRCLAIADHVALLQRSNWTGGGSNNGKNDFFRAMPPDLFPVPDRIKFMINGEYPRHPEGAVNKKGEDISGRLMSGDSIEYTWFVWGPERVREFGRYKNLASTPLEERLAG